MKSIKVKALYTFHQLLKDKMEWKNVIHILGLGQCGREKESNRRLLFFLLHKKRLVYLFFWLEYIASEQVAGSITNNVAENLQILRIMGYIEDPWRKQRIKSQHWLNINTAGRNNIYFVRFSASHLYMGSCITSILLSSHVHSFLLRSKQGKCQGLYCKCSLWMRQKY